VNLVIPTLNDDPKMIDEMCRWIKENLGAETPLHFTRFLPNYKLMHLYPTAISTLDSAYDIAKKNGLRYVYIGNVPGHIYNSSFCPKCGNTLIERTHFTLSKNEIKNGRCIYCQEIIPGIWT
jgi:pyruvate formate lyase activating enzyme